MEKEKNTVRDKCWRTIDPVQEPTDCIAEKCSAWINSKSFKGCAFVVAAQTTALANFIVLREDYDKKNKITIMSDTTPTVGWRNAGDRPDNETVGGAHIENTTEDNKGD